VTGLGWAGVVCESAAVWLALVTLLVTFLPARRRLAGRTAERLAERTAAAMVVAMGAGAVMFVLDALR
jgi:hypothetical protein